MRTYLPIDAQAPMPRFQRPIIFILICVLITGVPGPGFAQQASTGKPQGPAPQSQPTSPRGQDVARITTQPVQVDAVVTDKKGKHVEDLTEGDFELLVDGKKEQLTHFSHISLPAPPREPTAKKKDDLVV